jgi:signal transduction histidine kinase
VVKRHDGKIWAEGRRGEGAAIYFTLEPPRSGKEADTSADAAAR